jgi:predicted ATPase
MLFKSLALKNFKCFEEVEVEFAPITLLTGANSSGKSSLIYSLLAMLQTEQFPFYLSPNGKYVDMGSFVEMVSFQNKNCFEILVQSYDILGEAVNYKSEWIKSKNNILPIINRLSAQISDWNILIDKSTSNNKYLLNIFLKVEEDEADLFEFMSSHSPKMYGNMKKHVDKENGNVFSKIENQEFNSIEEIISFIQLSAYTLRDYLEDNIRTLNDNFNYLGSFRLPPERTYYQKAKAKEKVGVNGEGYIDQIIEWEETNPEKFKELNEIMAELELIQSIQSEKMKGGRFELTVKTKENSTSASLTDVGFGISQFLPLIVADLQLPETSCLALSQPEIHLHPKIQALFGNYLAKQINKSPKQYIVETHSEYLLNRIRLLLVKGEIKPEDVRIYYFENDGIKSVIHNVEFTIDGQIKGAPDGFFDTYGMDVMDIALNA